MCVGVCVSVCARVRACSVESILFIWPVEQSKMTSTLGVEIHLISFQHHKTMSFQFLLNDRRNP